MHRLGRTIIHCCNIRHNIRSNIYTSLPLMLPVSPGYVPCSCSICLELCNILLTPCCMLLPTPEQYKSGNVQHITHPLLYASAYPGNVTISATTGHQLSQPKLLYGRGMPAAAMIFAAVNMMYTESSQGDPQVTSRDPRSGIPGWRYGFWAPKTMGPLPALRPEAVSYFVKHCREAKGLGVVSLTPPGRKHAGPNFRISADLVTGNTSSLSMHNACVMPCQKRPQV